MIIVVPKEMEVPTNKITILNKKIILCKVNMRIKQFKTLVIKIYFPVKNPTKTTKGGPHEAKNKHVLLGIMN